MQQLSYVTASPSPRYSSFKLNRADKLQSFKESWFSSLGRWRVHPGWYGAKSTRWGLYLEYPSQTDTTHMSQAAISWTPVSVDFLSSWDLWGISEQWFHFLRVGRGSKWTLFLGLPSLGGRPGGLCVSATMETLHWSAVAKGASSSSKQKCLPPSSSFKSKVPPSLQAPLRLFRVVGIK